MPPVQFPPPANCTFPSNCTEGLFEQIFTLEPASTIGAGLIVIDITSLTDGQAPLPIVWMVSVAVPAEISLGDGM